MNGTLSGSTRAGAVLVAAFVSGCASMPRQPAASLTGSFAGETATGAPIMLDLVQRDGGAFGRGELDGRPFALSALTRLDAPAVLVFEDGTRREAELGLSADGLHLVVRGLEADLSRRGPTTPATRGAFAGRYVADGEALLELDLTQHDHLIAGTGWFEGRAVAVAGRVEADGEASASVLFADDSASAMRVRLERDGLVVVGLGGEWRMKRR